MNNVLVESIIYSLLYVDGPVYLGICIYMQKLTFPGLYLKYN